jgi:hypothetical protein
MPAYFNVICKQGARKQRMDTCVAITSKAQQKLDILFRLKHPNFVLNGGYEV